MQGIVLLIAAEHAGPHDRLGDTELTGPLGQGLLHPGLVGAGNDEAQSGLARRAARKGLQGEIEALLQVDATQEQDDALVAKRRPAAEEARACGGRITAGGAWCAKAHDMSVDCVA